MRAGWIVFRVTRECFRDAGLAARFFGRRAHRVGAGVTTHDIILRSVRSKHLGGCFNTRIADLILQDGITRLLRMKLVVTFVEGGHVLHRSNRVVDDFERRLADRALAAHVFDRSGLQHDVPPNRIGGK